VPGRGAINSLALVPDYRSEALVTAGRDFGHRPQGRKSQGGGEMRRAVTCTDPMVARAWAWRCYGMVRAWRWYCMIPARDGTGGLLRQRWGFDVSGGAGSTGVRSLTTPVPSWPAAAGP
jgi:hypothetical protein